MEDSAGKTDLNSTHFGSPTVANTRKIGTEISPNIYVIKVPKERAPLLDSHQQGSSSFHPTVPTSYQNPPEVAVFPASGASGSRDEADGVIPPQRHGHRKGSRTSDGSEVALKVYKSRFWILITFSILAWFQCVQWNTWGPISESVDAAFTGWGSQTVAMMANWGTITFVLSVVPMCWLMETKGLRAGVLTCTILVAIGTVVRIIPFLTHSDSFFTVMCHICAIFVGIPGTLIMAAPPMIAASWFPPKERTTATAFSQVMNQLGNAGSYLEPLIVRAPGEGVTPSDIQSDIKLLLYIYAGFAVALMLAILAYFPSKPPTPPSITSSIERHDFVTSLKKIIRNRDLMLVTLSYGVSVGVPAAWMSVLNYSLKELGIHQDDAMWIGILGVIMSGICGLLAGRMTDIVYGHVRISLIFLMISTVACFYWFFLLTWGSIPVTTWQVYFTVVGGLSFNFATAPLFFELAVETAYPCPEVVVGGLVTATNNLLGLFFLMMFFIPDIGYQWVTYLLLASSSTAILPLLFVREDYARSNIDRGEPVESAYQPI
nr:disrupted in renal carcinoma protein 2 homolog isoform X1 [Penaeus vannamei]XP_027214481.1 disrupted in renal carcinoma protein 2 homolog isoform X1 [Penaeus vannamei]XP_027214482.1 disrupted in renal carcinoma protein 2 homolog isoform X1 [Penaeus vannamei]